MRLPQNDNGTKYIEKFRYPIAFASNFQDCTASGALMNFSRYDFRQFAD
jgi:hypothetical protein